MGVKLDCILAGVGKTKGYDTEREFQCKGVKSLGDSTKIRRRLGFPDDENPGSQTA